MRINETKIKSDPKEGKIAINSPLGKALLGHVVGDVVTVVTPNGSYDVTIKNVE